MKYELCRVYFNIKGDPAKLWSVDSGVGTRELQTGQVKIITKMGFRSCVTKYDPEINDPKQAKAWIELTDVEVCVTETGEVVICM
jgi:hypothetical protein